MAKKEVTTVISSIDTHMTEQVSSVLKITSTTSPSISARQTHNTPARQRMIQNFLLIWLDANIDESSNTFRSSITHLRRTVNTINVFLDANRCIDFLSQIKNENVLMIVSGALGQYTVPLIHDMTHLNCIFVLCRNKPRHEQWTKDWPKVKGVFTEIDPICESLKQAARQCDHDSISISFVPASEATNQNLDQLDQSFMYTQILKEILLDIEYDEQSVKDLTAYCREQYVNNHDELNNITKFEQEYRLKKPIWWYSYECFLYSMLNRALRTQEVDTIIKMGFFIRDLHRQIQQLHSEQFGDPQIRTLTVYRGQGLSRKDFEKLLKTQGGLMSFNNFLSTSKEQGVSFAFADSNRGNPDLIGILFVITIDKSISTTPFALTGEFSHYQSEREILFSMHTVFRIGEIKKLDDSSRLWQVELKLTSDNDPLLNALTDRMREETEGSNGWYRLGRLLIKLGHFDQAEEVYLALLHQTKSDDSDRAYLYNQFGAIKDEQGDYVTAISFHEKSLEIFQRILPSSVPDLAISYNNIGGVYKNMGEYLKALSFYEKALEIRLKALPSTHPSLATSYNNIGSVYDNRGDYSKALPFYEKALEIVQNTLPPNHPDLATSYSNIGGVYDNTGEYSKALSFYRKALEVREKTLPPNHPSLSTSYNNIGSVYNNMSKYSKALSFYEKALEIIQKALHLNHPDLATSYSNIGGLYLNMGEYSKALSFYEKALAIYQRTLPPNHPWLATSYSNIGGLYLNMGEYSKVLLFYEKALEIYQKTLPSNHPSLATSYNNISLVYNNMGEYSKALSFYQKALVIFQRTLPSNHPDLATSHNNIGGVYENTGEYSKALSFYEKALEIYQKAFPSNHPDLAISYNNIGSVYDDMGEYSKALSFYEKAVEIYQKTLPPNHSCLATSYNNMGLVYNNTGDYSIALSFYEKALDIYQKTTSLNCSDLATSYSNIGGLYLNIGEYSKALSFHEKALDIRQKILPPNHPDLATSSSAIGLVYYTMGEYSKVLPFFERALAIRQRSLPPNHLHLETLRQNIETVRRKL